MSPDELELDAGLAPEEGGGKGGKGGGEKKKKSKLMLIIILVVGMAVLGAGGFFGWQMFFAPKEKPAAEKDKAADEKGDKAEGKEDGKAPIEVAKPGTVLNLEPFIVNLADPAGKRYLKLSLAVDAKDLQTKAELEARMPQIRDSILILLTSKSYGDIAPVAGKIRLRNEMLKIINRFLGGAGSVHAVYFTEFVVQ